MRFIGEEGFYPAWARGNGRWVIQRTQVITKGLLEPLDLIAKPKVADEGTIWVPPLGGFRRLVPWPDQSEAFRVIDEVQSIRWLCTDVRQGPARCVWKGNCPRISTASAVATPRFWRLRCPECFDSKAVPDLDGLRADVIIGRWRAEGCPKFDAPWAAASIVSVAPVENIEAWIETDQPSKRELAYVGQQLWPDLATFIADATGLTRMAP